MTPATSADRSPTGSPRAHQTAPGLPLSMAGGNNPWLIAVVVSIATFMEALDTSIANVALSHIAGNLSVSLDESTWVLTSYLVSTAVVLPISGWLATVIGRKRFYMGCVALFTISSMLCGLAPSLTWLIVCRVLQGAGGGGLQPSEQSMLADTFLPEQRGMAFGLYGVAVVVAPAAGPTLGGWITDNYSWHWIFLMNVPVGVLSLILTYALLVTPPAEERRRREVLRRGLRIDYIGFGLVALGLGCLQIVLDKGQRDDWFASTFIIVFTVISAVALLALLVWELTHEEPIVDLPLLKDKNFFAANVVMFVVGFILYTTTSLLPQLAQSLLGYTATIAGLVITPGGFALMVLMPLEGFLLGKLQPRTLMACGLLIEAFSLYHMSQLSLQMAYVDVMWARLIQASGIAFLFVPITAVAYVGLPPGKNNNASALINLMRNLGGSFGISLAQTWLARRTQFHQARLVSHITPYNPQYQRTLQQITRTLTHTAAAPDRTSRQVVGVIYGTVQQQAMMMSYLDIFYLLAWVALLMILLVFLLRKVKSGQARMAH
jgi:MFS transporter, DHA2 family, multidrug resistance protein